MVNRFILVLLLVITSSNTWANIPTAYQLAGKQHGIQPLLLYAIALVESEHTVKGVAGAWPWTLNISGQPYYFGSREEAYQRLMVELDERRNEDIAIGPMQIFWRYNKTYFSTPWHALDPYKNIDVGALIFNYFYRRRGSLAAAIGAYHSPNKPLIALRYRQKVCQQLQQLISYQLDLGSPEGDLHEESTALFTRACRTVNTLG